MVRLSQTIKTAALGAGFACCLMASASATEIVVAQYGNAPNGYPYAVAMEKGFFQEEGADVTGIISSKGGGTTLRNLMASNVPYGEAGPGGILVANRQGADLVIISDNVPSVGDINWVALKDSPLNGPEDLKGKRIGYTNPRSVTQALAYEMLRAIDLPQSDVELVSTGGFGEGLAALETGLVDVAPLVEPLSSKFPDKYKIIVPGTVLPPLDNTVGVTTPENAKGNEDFIKGVLRARRRAVQFMYEHPDEAGDIIAKVYNLDPEVARMSVNNLVKIKTGGQNYYSEGQINLEGMKRIVAVQTEIGAIEGEVDLEGAIDTQYLPEDLQEIK